MKKSTTSKSRPRVKTAPRRGTGGAMSSGRTLTKVKTHVITDTKILMATVALLMATGLSLIAVPAAPQQSLQLAVGGKCGVNRITYGRVCGPSQYTSARMVCHDGSFQDISNGCYSVAKISATANAFCQNKCANAAPAPQRPLLSIRTNVDTPLPTNLLLGSVDNVVAKFDLTASAAEDINLRELVVSFHTPGHLATGTLSNIRLYDGDVQVSENLASIAGGPVTSTFHNAAFHNVNLRLVRNQTKTLRVKADLNSYENNGFVSGVRFQPVILNTDYDAVTPGVQLAVNAVGAVSGTALEARDITFVSNVGTVASGTSSEQENLNALLPRAVGYVGANQFVVYRTKVAVMWAGDTPSGLAAPQSGQVIGKFVVSNIANNGAYTSTIQAANVNLVSNIVFQGGRALSIYRDSLQRAALATTQYQSSFSGNSGFSDAAFADNEISSGANRIFLVTADTFEAAMNQNLSVTVPWSMQERKYFGVLWSDGVVTNIVAHDNTLPLSNKTFTY